MVTSPRQEIDRLLKLYSTGNFLRVAQEARSLLNQYPSSVVLWKLLGEVSSRRREFPIAEEAYAMVGRLDPTDHVSFCKLCEACLRQGKLPEALNACNKAIALAPGYAEAHFNRGNVLKAQGRLRESIESYEAAISLDPTDARPYNNMGNVLRATNAHGEAIGAYREAIRLNPRLVPAYNNLAVALTEVGEFDAAVDACDTAFATGADNAELHYNRANVLQHQRRLEDAIVGYRRAVALQPGYAEAYGNLGRALQEVGRTEEAAEAYQKAIALQPDRAELHYGLGIVLKNRGRHVEAIEAFDVAVSLDPSSEKAYAQILDQKRRICDWRGFDADPDRAGRLGTISAAVPPFLMFAVQDDPESQLLRARRYAKENFTTAPRYDHARRRIEDGKVRIGYISSDFKEHPVAYLLAKIIEAHDRARFEVFGYSIAPPARDTMAKRLVSAFDVFRDVHSSSDLEVADTLAADGIDIAIDLNGYTQYSRTGILSCRPAPVQINYLGFPGSMGVDFIDYIVADSIVIPKEERSHYFERVMSMPHTYLPTDDSRVICESGSTRSDLGLPEDAFVFCCFNSNYKIGPREFAIWMRLLHGAANSVLWIRESNELARGNMLEEAGRHGVSAERIVFAPKVPMSQHLARYRHADLFLDTFNFNAHTTASEALWAGLPVITKRGRQFASRVASSLLAAVGLPELVTDTEEQYEAVASDLSQNTGRLAALREGLEANLDRAPLFQSVRYARNLEQGYLKALQRYRDGKEPEDIQVDDSV